MEGIDKTSISTRPPSKKRQCQLPPFNNIENVIFDSTPITRISDVFAGCHNDTRHNPGTQVMCKLSATGLYSTDTVSHGFLFRSN